jgi:hypothetical protein
MQNMFIQSQMQVLSDQVKGLGETINKAAMDSLKTPTKGDRAEKSRQNNLGKEIEHVGHEALGKIV